MANSTEDYLDSLLASAMGKPIEDEPVVEEPVQESIPADEGMPMESVASEDALADPFAEPVEELLIDEATIEEALIDEAPIEDALIDEAPIEEAFTDEASVDEVIAVDEAEEDANAAREDVNADEADELFKDEEIDSLLDSIGELDDSFEPKEDSADENHDAQDVSSEEAADAVGEAQDEMSSDFGDLDLSSDDLSAMLDDVTSSVESEGISSTGDDMGLDDLLAGIGGEDSDLSDIGDLLGKDENAEIVDTDSEAASMLFDADVESDGFDIDSILDDGEGEELSKKERKKRKKEEKAKKKAKGEGGEGEKTPGFFARLFAFLFDDDEEEEADSTKLIQQDAVDIAAEGAAENDAILDEIDSQGDEAPGDGGKKKKEKKKKDKDKKKKGKDSSGDDDGEGEEGEPKKKEKKKKEKKPKLPEAPLKKLPTKKVIVIAIFAVSIAAIMIFLAIFVPYTQDISKARKHYATGNYDKTYEYLRGHKLSDEDKALYNKTVVILKVQRQIDSYRNYMKLRMKPEALNALIQGIDAMDTYAQTANTLGIMNEYALVSSTLVNELNNSFGVSVDMAREWVAIEGTREYTKALYDFLGETPKNPTADEEGGTMMPIPNSDIQILIQEENEDNGDAL